MRHLYELLFISSIVLSFNSEAQTISCRFQSLSLPDGLPHSIVNHAMQDSQGFMWFSTHGGLSRYDGYSFRTFVPQNDDRTGLLHYEVEAAQEDAHQNIWIRYSAGGVSRYNMLTQQFSHHPLQADSGSVAGGFAARVNRENIMFVDRQKRVWFRTVGGLRCYDEATDGFITYAHRSDDPVSLAGDYVNHLLQDTQNQLWVATDSGLSRFDEGTRAFVNYDVANSGLGHRSVLSLYEDAQHYLWAGTADGLSRSRYPLNGSSRLRFVTYRPVEQPRHRTNAIRQIVPHPDGSLWLATDRGVVRAGLTADEVSFQVYLNEPEHLDVTGAHPIVAVYHDSQGTTWAHAQADKRGLFRYLPQDDRFVSLSDNRQVDSPPTNAISHIYEGEQGILWLCTWRSGVLKLDLQAPPFVHYQPDSVLENDAYAINRADQRLWIGTANGLYEHHLPTGRTKKIPYGEAGSSPDYPKIVGAIAHDSLRRSLWLGYYDYKVSRLSLDDYSATHYHYHDNRTDRYRPWSVRTICQDASGRIWVGAVTGGLHYYHPKSDRFYEYDLPIANLRYIKALHLQSDSLLWVGTMQQGLHRLNLRSGQLTSFRQAVTPRFPSDNVAAVTCSADRTWIGTAYGLAEIDAQDQIVRTYTTSDGLCNNNVKALASDRRGRLWVSTNDGLSCFDPATGTFSNYYTNDGLLSNEFNQGASFVDQEGTIYFGSSKGVTAFDPDLIKPTPTHAPLRMVDIQISNVSLNSGDTIQGRIPLMQNSTFTSEVVLPYRASNVMFQFATLNYRSPLASRYAYRLEGLDAQWNVTDATHRRATYTNLSPGTYRFWVQDLHSAAPATSVEVTVLAPWWATTWFRVLIGCLLIGLLVGWNRWRHGDLVRQRETLRQVVGARTSSLQRQSHELLVTNQALRKKQREVTEQTLLVQQMAEAVHRSDQMKIRFFTQMSHEFRTPLT
ncbi:MAG: two-component regulator propeller domain-containing protein, partial [Tunicatimonas sp.]